ncbi:MAG: RNA 2'-phosphotransferase [Deltaproteobacteria bacterium]|nr:RNA 2'-phosphotransferase [Deltaproteobacteria bacterium]MBW2069901.1 RNA 2'-phosphotransferase [Deltaproteobacteria bacterium]
MARNKGKQLAKILQYILLYRPDEFGLFFNEDGTLPIKELLWALHEEKGWTYVRPSHLTELLYSGMDPGFIIEDKQIKIVRKPKWSLSPAPPPTLLFHAARQRAYPVIRKHGLRPTNRSYVPLASCEELAVRIGSRRDAEPVLLTIHAGRASKNGIPFYSSHGLLYLAEQVPVEYISGPPLREHPPAPSRQKTGKPSLSSVPPTPGSFVLDPARDLDPQRRQRQEKKERQKRDIRRQRRKKRRQKSW